MQSMKNLYFIFLIFNTYYEFCRFDLYEFRYPKKIVSRYYYN